MTLQTGVVVVGKVVKLLKYGVIVELPDNQSGLIHISEIADEYVHDVHDFFREGDEVKVKVLGQREEGRYELSAKQAEARKPLPDSPSRSGNAPRMVPEQGGGRASGGMRSSFEERLSEFLRDSNRKLNEMKRDRMGKRRGRR